MVLQVRPLHHPRLHQPLLLLVPTLRLAELLRVVELRIRGLDDGLLEDLGVDLSFVGRGGSEPALKQGLDSLAVEEVDGAE